MKTMPSAPGQLGTAPTAAQLLAYLSELDTWLSERRAELDTLDQQILTSNRQAELTADMSLALALWQAAKTRQGLLLATWDSGRVGAQELERLSALIWGRLDTAGAQLLSLQSMAVSLPEAGRLCDALVAQLRVRLNTDPNATALELRLRDLRAQAERIRDQLAWEPPALAPVGAAKLDALRTKIEQLNQKRDRGGDIAGVLGTLEIDAARLERDLIVAAARRREGRELLTRVREARTEASAHEFAVRTLADQVSAAVWPIPPQKLPSVEALGAIPNTADGLNSYLGSLTNLGSQLSASGEQLRQLLTERDAAAGQLSALQAKAQALGKAAEPSLAQLADLIQARLAATPVVLPVVGSLLSAYAGELDFLVNREQAKEQR